MTTNSFTSEMFNTTMPYIQHPSEILNDPRIELIVFAIELPISNLSTNNASQLSPSIRGSIRHNKSARNSSWPTFQFTVIDRSSSQENRRPSGQKVYYGAINGIGRISVSLCCAPRQEWTIIGGGPIRNTGHERRRSFPVEGNRQRRDRMHRAKFTNDHRPPTSLLDLSRWSL